MRKLLLSMLVLLLAVSANAVVIGYESFDYPGGSIDTQTGGTGWDYNRATGTQTGGSSSWIRQAGATDVIGNELVIQNSDPSDGWISARRAFGSNEDDGAFQASGIVYFASTLTIGAEQGWLGIGANDWGDERVKFGMPWNGGVMNYLGINNENTGISALSDILATVGTTYRIVGVVDFDNDAARMWIDPDISDHDHAWDDTTADVVFNSLNMTNWISSVRLASDQETTWDDLVVATTFEETFTQAQILRMAHGSDPANGAIGVGIDSLVLSWDVARDASNSAVADPDLLSHEVYMGYGSDPNLFYVGSVPSWNPGDLRASYTMTSTLLRDEQYSWRVKEIRTSGDVEGFTWRFDTEKSIPVIDAQPGYQAVDATGTANFTVTVSSISPETYQWYKVDAAGDVMLSDSDVDISGAASASVYIANVEMLDEGAYYCVINNSSGTPTVSNDALLGVKRMIANWSFEGSSQSDVAGSPSTRTYGDPTIVPGNVGDGMSFDGDDLLYVDPNFSSYFDICNSSMTVSCWIQSSFAGTWNPLISRHGDSGLGWQFRHHGDSQDRITLTARGTTGYEEGSYSDRTVFDGNWHHAVATYDGVQKKVYIDGVLSASDDATGLITSTVSPVALAGRVIGGMGSWEYQGFMSCILDDVSIYNYAQDAIAVAQVYADVTQTDVCPEHPVYDVDGDCMVTLSDLAKLASEWLLDNTVYPN